MIAQSLSLRQMRASVPPHEGCTSSLGLLPVSRVRLRLTSSSSCVSIRPAHLCLSSSHSRWACPGFGQLLVSLDTSSAPCAVTVPLAAGDYRALDAQSPLVGDQASSFQLHSLLGSLLILFLCLRFFRKSRRNNCFCLQAFSSLL